MISRLLCLVFFISLSASVAAKPQLRWCLGTFPGFYGFNPVTKQPEGPSVQYLQEIARRANFTLLPSAETPSSRCFAQMKAGETDLMINILKPTQSSPDIRYIQFGARWPDRIYYAKDKALRLDRPSQLSPLTLVTVRNYKAVAEIQAVLDQMKPRQLVQVGSVLTALQIAAKQRTDAALLPPSQVAAVFKEHPELAAELKEISFSAEQVTAQSIYMGLSSRCNCAELEIAIKRSIQSMMHDGTTKKIFADKIIVEF